MDPTELNAANAAEAAMLVGKLNQKLADLQQAGCAVSVVDEERVDRVALTIEFPVRPQ